MPSSTFKWSLQGVSTRCSFSFLITFTHILYKLIPPLNQRQCFSKPLRKLKSSPWLKKSVVSSCSESDPWHLKQFVVIKKVQSSWLNVSRNFLSRRWTVLVDLMPSFRATALELSKVLPATSTRLFIFTIFAFIRTCCNQGVVSSHRSKWAPLIRGSSKNQCKDL